MSPSDPAQRRSLHLQNGKKRKPFLIFDFALRRGPLILLVGTLMSILMLLLLLPKMQPVFEADAMLMIDPTKEPTLTGRERDPIPGNFGDWTRTQMTRMTSEDVLKEAIARTPPENLPNFLRENPQHPAAAFRLMRRIRIMELPRTYLIRLSIRNDDPRGIAELLNTVLEVYLEKIEREFEETYDRRKAYLVDERTKISSRLKLEETRLIEMAEQMPNKAFLHENYTVHLVKVEQLQRLYWEAFADATETRAQLNKVISDRERISQMSLQAFADARVADNFGINRIEQWTYEQLQQMRAQIDGLTPTNPDRVYVESRMNAMNEYLTDYKQRVNDETIKNLKEKQDFELETQELLARSAAEAADKRVVQMQQRLQEAQEEASKVSMAIFQASDPAFARSQLRDRLQALDNRIDDTEMEAKAPLRVRIDKPAAPPVEPSSTNIITLLLIAVIIGFGPIGSSLLVYEIADTRLRKTKEIEKALGGPAPDPINAFVAPVGLNPDFSRILLDTPEHPTARHIQELANRLVNDHQRFGSQIQVIAGLGRNCGTTSLSLNLAHAIQMLNGKVLLIEICPDHPGLQNLLKLPGHKGIESYLRAELDENQLIVHDAERNLKLILSEGGTPVARFDRLLPLIEELKQQVDIVLIDAGAFPENLCAHVMRQADALVLVARYKKTYFAELRQAIDLAIQSGVPAVTAILNFSETRETPFLVTAIQASVIAISTRMEKWTSRLPLLRKSK